MGWIYEVLRCFRVQRKNEKLERPKNQPLCTFRLEGANPGCHGWLPFSRMTDAGGGGAPPPSYSAWRAELLRGAGLEWHPHATVTTPREPDAPRVPSSQQQLPAVAAASPRPAAAFAQAEAALAEVRQRVRALQSQQQAAMSPVPPPARAAVPPAARASAVPPVGSSPRLQRLAVTREIDDDLLAAAAAQLEDVRRQILPNAAHLRAGAAAELLRSDEDDDDEDEQNRHFVRASSRLVRRTFSRKNGLKKQQLRHLRSVRGSTLTSKDRAEACVICQCPLVCEVDRGDDELIVVLKCGHHFHEDCIKQWLTRSSICPVCRAPAARKRKSRRKKATTTSSSSGGDGIDG
eukprot:COSAG06_NODE_4232_length_4446_cov_9.610076_6_plen_348_part_00